ncbi:MAG: hypothetical protein J6W75_02375 [Bacteroidaceae bacterium]|nr:hypothetical protein [Bacteroidaceae bacterium]
MKKYILSLALSFGSILFTSAMSYEEARQQALFLTDKMAYELNLNEQQYNDCYEINLDYLLSVETASDVYGSYLAYRNADLRHILYDWQYTLFAAADYFLNPLRWHRGAWYFTVYRHYARGYFYYSHPHVYLSYRGGHGRYYYSGGFYGSRRPHHWSGGLRGMDRGAIVHQRGGHQGGRIEGGRIGGGRSEHSGRIDRGHVASHHSEGRMGGQISSSRFGHADRSHSSSNYNHPSSTRTTVHAGTHGRPSVYAGSFGGASRGGHSIGASRGGGQTRSGVSGGSRRGR